MELFAWAQANAYLHILYVNHYNMDPSYLPLYRNLIVRNCLEKKLKSNTILKKYYEILSNQSVISKMIQVGSSSWCCRMKQKK